MGTWHRLAQVLVEMSITVLQKNVFQKVFTVWSISSMNPCFQFCFVLEKITYKSRGILKKIVLLRKDTSLL